MKTAYRIIASLALATSLYGCTTCPENNQNYQAPSYGEVEPIENSENQKPLEENDLEKKCITWEKIGEGALDTFLFIGSLIPYWII